MKRYARLMKQVHINTESTRSNPQTYEAERNKKKGKTFAPVILYRFSVRGKPEPEPECVRLTLRAATFKHRDGH